MENLTPRGGRRRWALGVLALIVAMVPLTAHQASAASTGPARFESVPLSSWRVDGVGWVTLVVGDTVYVGGDFSTVHSPDGSQVVTRNNLAAFDVNTGAIKSSFIANTNGIVRSLVTANGKLYVGGAFTRINGVVRGRLAAVDLGSGAVDSSFNVAADSNVYALAVAGPQLFVGGSFMTLNGISRSRIGSVNLGGGTVTPYAPVLDNTVTALTTDATGSRVYIGGSFTMVSGFAQAWLAKTDAIGQLLPMTWEQLQGPGLDLELSADGTRLAVSQGGSGNQGSWYNVDTGARIFRQRCDGDGQAIHVIDGTMFSGFHEACDGDTTQRLTANFLVDGARDLDFKPTFDKFWGIRGIDGNAQHLVIAGDFTSISGVSVSGFAIFPFRYVPPPPVELSPAATWHYLVTPTAPVAAWNQAGFDDSTWSSGPAQLGFGDGDEATVIGYGPNANSKYITTYFRTTFDAASVPDTLSLALLADDGAVVYINGTEVVRDNLPAGTITWSTRAVTGRSGAAESTLNTFAIPPSSVVPGTNTIAVEVHQDAATSSDLSFLAAITSTGTIPTTTTTTSTTTTSTTTTTIDPTTTTTSLDPTTTTTSLDPTTTTTIDPTTTTTSLDPTTTTTAAPTTTTIPTGPPALYTDTFTGADSSPWTNWATSAASGSATIQGNAGSLAYTDVANAFARAQLTGLAARSDSTVTFSYRWSGTTAAAYFNLYSRGSGGWLNAYRPRDGYGLEFASNSSSITVRKVAGGTLSTVRTVTGAQSMSTQKQWVKLRVVGTTIQFKTWLDGQAEPAGWRATDTDAGVTSAGQLYLSIVRGSTNAGAKSVTIDDLTVTDGS